MFSFVIAMSVSDLSVVLAFVGATGSTAVSYILPGFFYYYMFKNPEVDIKIAVIALVVLIVSGAIAGLIPANRAVRVKPIDAIREEK